MICTLKHYWGNISQFFSNFMENSNLCELLLFKWYFEFYEIQFIYLLLFLGTTIYKWKNTNNLYKFLCFTKNKNTRHWKDPNKSTRYLWGQIESLVVRNANNQLLSLVKLLAQHCFWLWLIQSHSKLHKENYNGQYL